MKKLFFILGVMSVGFAQASSSIDRKLEDCRGDETCMLKLVAELIENNQSDNSDEIVEFYHDDGRCEFGNLIKRVRFGISSEACQRAAATVTQNVWGVRVDGRCADISDTSFLNACNAYAAVDKSKAKAK